MKKYLSELWHLDWILLIAVILLISFGLAALYSVALSQKDPNFLNFKKQLIFAGIGILLVLVIGLVDYRWWEHYGYLIYIIAGLLLLTVLIFGQTLRGTTGWFSFFGFTFQPVEIAKLALITVLAKFFSQKAGQLHYFKNIFFSGLFAALFFLLVILQPDFGSAILLFLIWLGLLLFLSIRKAHLLLIVSLIIFSLIIGWFFLLKDYQKDRILILINPDLDPYGRGYHVRQAVIAVGAGNIFGRGLGFGSQSQLKFIPASQTDFIFAVIAEELGFLGVSLIIIFWGVIFYRLIEAAKNASDNFSLIFILGTSILFFIQFFINIGMNIGLVPVTGISSPFLSYGGSFLITSLILIGIVESIISRSVKYKV